MLGLVLLLNVLWTPVNFMVSWAMNNGFTSAGVGRARWTTISLLMIVLLALPGFRKLTGYRQISRRDWLIAFAIGLLLFGPSHILYYASMKLTTEVEGTVILSMAPLFTGFLGFLILHEQMPLKRAIAIGLSVIGAYIVAVGFSAPSMSGNAKGNLMFGLGVVLECLMGVIAAKLSRRSSGVAVLSPQMLGGATAFWLVPALFPADLPVKMGHSLPAFLPIAYLVVMSGLITFTIWYRIVEDAPLTLLVVGIALQPPLAAVMDWAFKGAIPKTNTVIGACVIVAALALGFFPTREKVSARSAL